VISRANVRWVPPPVGGRYAEFRIELERKDAGPALANEGKPAAPPQDPPKPRESDDTRPTQTPGED
jgi:hypothetical protein